MAKDFGSGRSLLEWLEGIWGASLGQAQFRGAESLLNNTGGGLGGYAAADTIERGFKDKPLSESAREEAVDVVICALSLFFVKGGTVDELLERGPFKFAKWRARLDKAKAYATEIRFRDFWDTDFGKS